MAIFLTFIPGLLVNNWESTIYGFEKVLHLYTLTLLGTLAPLWLVRSRASLRRLLTAFALVGVVVVFDLCYTLLTIQDVPVLMFRGGGTIATGRMLGVLLAILFGWRLSKRGTPTGWRFVDSVKEFIGKPFPLLIAIAFLMLLLFAVGQRGPLFGAIITLTLGWLVFRRRGNFRRIVLFICLFVVASAIGIYTELVPKRSVDRVVLTLRGGSDRSTASRVEIIRGSFFAGFRHPLGVGLGSFEKVVRTNRKWDQLYAHNILAETWLEGGWLAYLWLTVVIFAAVWNGMLRSYQSGSAEQIAAWLVLIFLALNAQISGDLNGNRPFLGMLGVFVAQDLVWPRRRADKLGS